MFDIKFDYDDVWFHSATSADIDNLEFTLHFSKGGMATGDLTLRFSSEDAVNEFIDNLLMAFRGPQSLSGKAKTEMEA